MPLSVVLEEGKCHSSVPPSTHLSGPVAYSLFKQTVTTRVLSRGIYLHHTVQGRHIFKNYKIMLMNTLPVTLQVCQTCQLVPST